MDLHAAVTTRQRERDRLRNAAPKEGAALAEQLRLLALHNGALQAEVRRLRGATATCSTTPDGVRALQLERQRDTAVLVWSLARTTANELRQQLAASDSQHAAQLQARDGTIEALSAQLAAAAEVDLSRVRRRLIGAAAVRARRCAATGIHAL